MMNADTLIRPGELATMCQADLKTIHNWERRGKGPPSFKTPGGHMRFKAADVAAWLAKFGYPVPSEMAPLLSDRERAVHEAVRRA